MCALHDGEIIIKEKYGSRSIERLYVRPSEQHGIVTLDGFSNLKSDLTSWFENIFLPQGYPDSVSKDYLAYQIWDTAQAFCSTITGILATQEVLRGVGVGDTTATPLAATITWVIKDGCGHFGRIIFAFSHGSYLDAYSKKWRLYADTLNDAAMCIEMSLPLFKNYTTFALCVSTAMKAIVGVAGGATRAALTQHHAIRGNFADVSAKDAAQETAVNLVASLTALLILSTLGNSLTIFVVMLVLHIAFNYFAVRAVCLRTLNEPRYLQVIRSYLLYEAIITPCEINRDEPIIFYQMGPNVLDLKHSGFKIKLGHSLKRSMNSISKASHMQALKEIFRDQMHLLVTDVGSRTMLVALREGADADHILKAYFHAVLFSIVICAINDSPLSVYHSTRSPRPFTEVCHALQSAEWSRQPVETKRSGFQYEPSLELMRYLLDVVNKEWTIVRRGLEQTGWDLSKHLLMVDEWRICRDGFVPRAISIDRKNRNSDHDTFPPLPGLKHVDYDSLSNDLDSDDDEEETQIIVDQTEDKTTQTEITKSNDD